MKPLTREWVDKAEGDWHTATRELRARKSPNYDAACFHAQQCVEKYLKARLSEAEVSIPRTHDLVLLLDLILPDEPLLLIERAPLGILSESAVELRYPGESADKSFAKTNVTTCRRVRVLIRTSLGLH